MNTSKTQLKKVALIAHSFELKMQSRFHMHKCEGWREALTDLNTGVNGTYKEDMCKNNKDADEHAQH